MNDLIWIISSSVLIAAVIAVRAIFGKKMSAGLRYALWGLVLLRLLVPGTFFKSPVSVSSAVQEAPVARDLDAISTVSAIAQTESGAVIGRLRQPAASQFFAAESGESSAFADAIPEQQTALILGNATPERFESLKKTLEARDILRIIWYTGMALTALYFIAANLRFYLRLRARRERLDVDAPCRVYSVDGLSSSCLFLNSIYISGENAADEDKLSCVLAHELSHRRHGDGVFALLRTAALIIHWFNPLVWAAAFISRRDSELFADAGAIKALGDDSREDYGRTLIELSARPSIYAPIACAATMMTGGKRELKSRITHIALDRRMSVIIAAAVLVLALAAVGCTFMGGENSGSSSSPFKFEMNEECCKEVINRLAEYRRDQLIGKKSELKIEVSDEVAAELEERQACIEDMYRNLGEKCNKVTGSVYFFELRPVLGYMDVHFREDVELFSGGNNLMGYSAEHRALIAPDGTVVCDRYSEEFCTGFSNFIYANEEDCAKLINKLAEYHAAQFSEAEPVLDLLVSDEVAEELEARKLCIDEFAKRIGQAFATADVSTEITDIRTLPSGLAFEIAYTETTKLNYKLPGNGSMEFSVDHTVTVSAQGFGIIAFDKYSEEDITGFTNLDESDSGNFIEQACLDTAWELAEKVCEAHGVEMQKESGTVKKNSLGEFVAAFSRKEDGSDRVSEVVSIVLDGSVTPPVITRCLFQNNAIPEIDEAKFQSDREIFDLPTNTQQYEIDTTGEILTVDRFAQMAADGLADRFIFCGDNNYFYCTDAAAVRLDTVSSDTNEGRYYVTVAVRPVNDALFARGFMENLGSLWNAVQAEGYNDDHHEFDCCYTLDYFMQVVRTGGNSFDVSYGYTLESFEG